MTDAAILTEKLTKHYGSLQAVHALDLHVPAGSVFGFLGPNRAGKTTTIRLLLKLVRPTAGRAWVLGQDVARGSARFLAQVGALVEAPAFYPYLSGRDNLRVFAHTGGYPDQKRIGEVLEIVGLADRQRDRVRTYSLGMKQRLAVAATLLNRPQLLFLDEPTNGLDPAGQAEIREIVRALGQAGHTIFISSHLLHEIEQICDHVAIIDRGQLLRQGTVAEILGEQSALRIEADPIDHAAALVTHLTHITPERTADRQLLIRVPRERAPEIVQALSAASVRVYQVVVERESLEQVFLRLTRAEALTRDEARTRDEVKKT